MTPESEAGTAVSRELDRRPTPRPWRLGYENGIVSGRVPPEEEPESHGFTAEEILFGGTVVAAVHRQADARLILQAIEHLEQHGALEVVARELLEIIQRRHIPSLALEGKLGRALADLKRARAAAAWDSAG